MNDTDYGLLYRELESLLADEPDEIARMAQTAALLHERLGVHWAGFYMVHEDTLVLGPFQGPPACFRIKYGKGVCGTAWKEARTVVVPDVEAFPGHIACSALSRSEIVVPVFGGGKIKAVLDIDSTALDAFNDTDAAWLEKVAALCG